MKTLTFLLLSLCTSAAISATPTKESIDTLLKETKIERTIDGMMQNMNQLMQQQMTRAMAGTSMTAEQQNAMQATQEKITALLRSEMTWQNLEPIYVEVYQQTYTQEEVDGLTAFYRTPTGQSYIDKMPLAFQKTVAAMQPLLNDMMQKAQAIGRQAVENAKTSKP